ncbi:hypothetical protein C8R44DRAFT_643845, partial [Mycena epipterygia]
MDGLPRELVLTNLPPTELQNDHVRRLLVERQRESLDLDRQYEIAQAAFLDISARRLRAQQDICTLQGVISPIRRIPHEILAEIFKICVEHSRLLHYSIDNPHLSPIVLGQVCSLWRNVAINTPRLWD